MRVPYISLLVAVLVCGVNASSIATEMAKPELQVSSQGNRALRAHKKTTDAHDEEERGVLDAIRGKVDEIVESMKLSPQFKSLLRKEAPAKDAFQAFNVGQVKENLLESAQWKEWALYVAKINQKTPDESLAAAMTVEYGGPGFSKIVASALTNPNTHELALKLENAQINRWITMGSKPDAIFQVLKLDQKSTTVFDSPQFATWTNFLTAYNVKHPGKDVSQLSLFAAQYGDDGFLKLLAAADDTAGTQTFKKELVKGWLDEPTHPLNVFNKLKLDEAGDDLLSNPLLSTWVQYMKAFNDKFPHAETTMIQTFTKSYKGDEVKLAQMLEAAKKVPSTEKIATNLQAAQFNQWMADKKTPKDMLNVLKINSQTFTDNPSAGIWRAYNKAYAKKFPDADFAFQP